MGDRTASSARSWRASCRRRSSTRTSARSPSWTSTPRRAGMRWWSRARTPRDLSRSAPRTWRRAADGRQRSPRASASAWRPTASTSINSCGAAAWQTVFHFHVHVIPRYERRSVAAAVDPRPGDPEQIAAAAAHCADDRREGRAYGPLGALSGQLRSAPRGLMHSSLVKELTVPVFTGRDRLRDQLDRDVDAVQPDALRRYPRAWDRAIFAMLPRRAPGDPRR